MSMLSDRRPIHVDPRRLGPHHYLAMVFVGLAVPVLGGAAVLYGLPGVTLSAFALAVSGGYAVHGVARSYPHDRLGQCNVVTAMRAGLVCLLVGALIDPMAAMGHIPAILAIAGVAFAMDGLDGWLARRSGLTSGFGARFDVEVDALLSATLALLILATGLAGPAVLILGFARYVFVAAIWIWPWLGAPLPERFGRKVICVIQIAGLIYALVPGALAVDAVILATAAAVLGSFAVDIRWLIRAR